MKKCSSREAQFMKITSEDKVITLEKTEKRTMSFDNSNPIEYLVFTFRLYTYYYHDKSNCFLPIQFALTLCTNNEIHEKHGRGVLSEQQLQQLKSIYGLNNTEIPDKSTFKILIDEVLSPFYIFQVFSVVLWMLEPYYYYASVILFTSVLSAVVSLVETRNNYKKLKKMSFFETPVYVYRGISEYLSLEGGNLRIEEDISKGKEQISSLNLVPGDIIEIPDGQILPCDVILLNGSSVMNESMLTGESIPIIKSALPFNNNKYNPNEDGKQSTLFAGTKCIETRYYLKGKIPVLGLVSQTSFNTMKGQLVRSILYPKSNSFSFYIDSLKFIAVLALISIVGFIVSFPFMIRGYNEDYLELRDLILNSLDLVTITVPPALPTCLSIGISFAMSRLRKQQIYCISPPKVNISGKVTIMCFDKTGTLTEEGLDMYGLRPVCYNNQKTVKFCKLQEETKRLGEDKMFNLIGKTEQQNLYGDGNPYSLIGDPEIILKECMASCHGLTRVKGDLIGDPLEVKMFEATEWVLIENDMDKYDELVLAVVQPPQKTIFQTSDIEVIEQSIKNNNLPSSIGIIKRFEFSSKLQRMSTIVRNLQNNTDFFRLHVKGSPEKIYELCRPQTIPQNFHEVLDFYARKGFRVLAFGVKVLKMTYRKIQRIERDEVENDLTFAGLLIMENKLKPITTQIIEELKSANIRTIMVTGDNALTAISVGRQCQIVDENKRVYFGDISDDPKKKNQIVWKDFEHADKILNEDNLEPANGVVGYHEEGIAEIQEEKKLFERANFIEKEDRKQSQFSNRTSIKNNSKKRCNDKRSYRERARTMSIQQGNGNNVASVNINTIIQENQPSINIQIGSLQQQSSLNKKLSQEIDVYESDNPEDEAASVIQDSENEEPWQTNQEQQFTLAITGRAFSKIIDESTQSEKKAQRLRFMLLKTQIFARMRPEEKAFLLQSLQELPWKPTCGMCGDGANDCGALKTADIGISLSEAEASIAAPFTSKIQDISCVIELLKEGRAALVTSFSCFKFMALYSMIQFFTTTLLYTVNSLPGDMQFLYWDVAIIIPLAFLMGLTDAYPQLSKQVPGSSLVSFPVLCSVIGQTVLNGGFQIQQKSNVLTIKQDLKFFFKLQINFKQILSIDDTIFIGFVIVFFVLKAQSWYMSVQDAHTYLNDLDNEDARKSCYESTTLFFFSNFQYISTCLAFSIGKPFKKAFYTNTWFTFSVVVIIVLSLYIQLIPDSFTRDFLNIFEEVKLADKPAVSQMPFSWLLILLAFAAASAFTNVLFEKFAVFKLSQICQRRNNSKRSQSQYLNDHISR